MFIKTNFKKGTNYNQKKKSNIAITVTMAQDMKLYDNPLKRYRKELSNEWSPNFKALRV